MLYWNPTVLGNDLSVESGLVESPFWHSFVKRRVHSFLEPRRLRTQLPQGCNKERLKREALGDPQLEAALRRTTTTRRRGYSCLGVLLCSRHHVVTVGLFFFRDPVSRLRSRCPVCDTLDCFVFRASCSQCIADSWLRCRYSPAYCAIAVAIFHP